MAAGAVDGHGGGSGHHLRHHVVQIQRAGAAAQDGALGFHLPDEIPRTGREEAGGHDGIGIVRPQHIAGDLFLQKAVVRLVGIEGTDDVVAVGPRIGPEFVALKSVRVRIVGNVQPMAGEAFAKVRRGQQAVDEFLVRLGIGIMHEGLDGLRLGRQSVQVKIQPPNQGASTGLRRRREFGLLPFHQDEGIDRVRHIRRRHQRRLNGLQRPMRLLG